MDRCQQRLEEGLSPCPEVEEEWRRMLRDSKRRQRDREDRERVKKPNGTEEGVGEISWRGSVCMYNCTEVVFTSWQEHIQPSCQQSGCCTHLHFLSLLIPAHGRGPKKAPQYWLHDAKNRTKPAESQMFIPTNRLLTTWQTHLRFFVCRKPDKKNTFLLFVLKFVLFSFFIIQRHYSQLCALSSDHMPADKLFICMRKNHHLFEVSVRFRHSSFACCCGVKVEGRTVSQQEPTVARSGSISRAGFNLTSYCRFPLVLVCDSRVIS